MSNKNIIDAKTLSLTADFFNRHEIRSMTIERGVGITKNTEISDISLFFIKDKENQSLDYPVQFKLQTECADISQYIKVINTAPTFDIELTPEAGKIKTDVMNDKLRSLIEAIRDRVKSAQKEEKVQNITYVGNTFILNNSTKFKVLSDEGEGRLNIEILTKDKPLDALLTASGLLDGLYLGSIKLVDAEIV